MRSAQSLPQHDAEYCPARLRSGPERRVAGRCADRLARVLPRGARVLVVSSCSGSERDGPSWWPARSRRSSCCSRSRRSRPRSARPALGYVLIALAGVRDGGAQRNRPANAVPDLTMTVLTMTLTGLAADGRRAGGSGIGSVWRTAALWDANRRPRGSDAVEDRALDPAAARSASRHRQGRSRQVLCLGAAAVQSSGPSDGGESLPRPTEVDRYAAAVLRYAVTRDS